MIPSPLSRAARDPDLTPMQVRAYTVLLDELDTEKYRPVKLVWLAYALHVKRPNASRVLRALTARGYLAQGPKQCEPGGQCYSTYRITNPGPVIATETLKGLPA